MTKHEQVDAAIIKIRDGGQIKMKFSELHWFLQVVERYKLSFSLTFTIKIDGENITLMGEGGKDADI